MTQRTKGPGHRETRVKSAIAQLARTGTVSLEKAAEHLGTSPRTLQRRLNQRGICFWALVDQSRFEIARSLLRDTDLKIQDIGSKLGYSTAGGFSRAFTRWAGCSPSVFRTTLAGLHHGASGGAKLPDMSGAAR
jgi:AraC-like DNA-binding protein